MSIKTRLEVIEKKVRPKAKPIRTMLKIVERYEDLDGNLTDEDGRPIPIMIMPRPGERPIPDTFAISRDFLPIERPKDTDPNTLTITYVETPSSRARDQAQTGPKLADVGELSEPDDDELEAEVKRLEARKAELMAKENEH